VNNNVHILPVAKKRGRRGPVPALPRAEVLQIVDHCRQQAAVETPEQRIARLEKLIDSIAYQLLTAARLVAASRSITSTKGD
jgi:hypothetical protein